MNKSAELLAKAGIRVDDAEIIAQLAEKGFDVDKSTRMVKIPVPLLEKLLADAPGTIKLYYRDLERNVEVGAEKTLFTPSGFGAAVLDRVTGERRPSTSKDVEEFVTVQNYLPNIDIVGLMVTATEVPAEVADFVEFYQLLRCTDKPFLFKAVDESSADMIMEMAGATVGGVDKLREKPIFCSMFCPTSPLLYSSETIRSMLKLASYGTPIIAHAMTMGGATAPVTVLGQIVQTNAEIIAGIAIVQAFYPGHPTFYGTSSSVMDMKAIVLSLGAPERPLINEACALVAKAYNLPSNIAGFSSDSKSFDEQITFEKVLTAMPLMNKASIVFGLGGMDSGNSFSLLQLIIDDSIAGAIRRYHDFSYGDNIDEEMEILINDGPDAIFLNHKHTYRNYKNYWRADFFTRLPYGKWKKTGESIEKMAAGTCENYLAKGISFMDSKTAEKLQNLYEECMRKSSLH